MLIHNAVITGSLTYNGVDISDITGSEASISALNSFSASMLNYTASNNVASASFSTRVVNLESTASVLTTASASFAIVSQSYASASGSLSTRVTNTETTASSLVTASGSFSTRVTNLELTGSSLVAASASFSTRVVSLESTASVLTTASSSFAQQSGSNSVRLTNLESTASVLTTASASFAVVSSSFASTSGSDSRRITNLESTASVLTTASASFAVVSSSYSSASGSLSTRVTTIEGSYATTGSNTFTGVQNITNIANAISFTSTGSLYTDGGARITKDLYVSGTSYFNNVTIYGTQSVNYITSSQLNIGTNIITVNTDTPTVRYGGIAVYDSGSTGLTGSLLWDSEQNHWIYTNPSGSTYSGGMMISGPRASARGCEVGTTSCALMMGQGGDHITSSAILHYGNATCFYGNATITSTGNICTSTAAFTSCASVGTTIQCNVFTVKGPFSGGYFPSNATTVPLANFVGDNPEVLISDYSNNTGRTATLRLGTTETSYYCYGAYVRAIQGSGIDVYSLEFGTSQNNPATTKLAINSAGVACFSSRVCTNGLTTIDQLTATTVNGGTSAIFLNSGAQNSNGIEIRGGTTGTAVNWKIEKDNTLSNSLQITPSTAAGGTTYTTPVWTLTSTGIACFGNTICAKSLWFSSNSTGQITFGSNDACNAYVVSDSNNALYLGNNNSYKIFVPNDGADMIFRTSATYGNPQTRLTITSTGVTTFACQVCTPQALITNNIRVGTTYGTTAQYSFGSTVGAQTTANLTDAGVQCGILEVLATGGTAGNGGALMLGSDTWGTGAGKGQIALKALLVNGSGCGTSDLAFSLRNDPSCSNLTERMRITVGGNVGIGTNSPGATLEVSGTGTTNFASGKGNLFISPGGTACQGAGCGGTLTFGAWLNGDLSNPYRIAAIRGISESSTTNTNTGALIFGTATTDNSVNICEQMRITSQGNVGIGVTPTTGNRFWVKGSSTSSGDTAIFAQNSGGTSLFTVKNNGDVQMPNGLVSIYQTSGYGALNVTGIDCAWGEGIVLNPAPNGYNAINFRAEGRTGSCYTATWQLGKISSGETSSGEAFSLNRAGLTGGTAYRADASQQWKTNGDSIFGFNVGIGLTTPQYALSIQRTGNVALHFSTNGCYTGDCIDITGGGNCTVTDGNSAFRIRSVVTAPAGKATGNLGFWVNCGDKLVERMHLSCLGNLGVGTSTPCGTSSERTIHLAGDSSTNATIYVSRDTYARTILGSNANGGITGTQSNHNLYVVTNDTARLFINNNGISCFSCIVCAPIHSATTRVLINSTCPCSMLMSIGGYGSTWGGNACYYGGGAAGAGIPNGDQYGNGSAYTYQTCNVGANNSALYGGFSAGYFRGGDGGAYGGGGAGVVAIGGNGANAESVNSHGGSGLFARGGIDGNGNCIRFAAWFDGGDVVMRCGRMGIGTCAPTDKLHVFGADNGITICSITANRPVLNFINGSTSMLKLSANGTYGAIASCTGDVMFFYGNNVGIGSTSPSVKLDVVGSMYVRTGTFYTDTIAGYTTGVITSTASILPNTNGTLDLGSSSNRWCTVYTSDLSLSNGIGDYTIVEGENDLFLYNNNSCKVYKFVVQEVCPEIAPAKRSI